MDLPLYWRVLWRFKFLVGAGFAASIALSILAYAHVSLAGGKPKLTPRQAEQWHAEGLLLISGRGFPWGTSDQKYVPGDPARGLPPVPVGDIGRLSSVAMIYSQLADSDEVKRETRPKPQPPMEKVATSPYAPASAPPGTVLPMVALSAEAATPARAAALVDARIDAFVHLIEKRQADAGTPKADRIVVDELNRASAGTATLVAGRKKTMPMVVFIAVMTMTCGLAFVLENLRPRVRPLDTELGAAAALDSRRSA